MNTQTANLEKIHGFDYLRAISCIFVLAIHTNMSSLFSGHKNLQNIILFNVWDLAVPIFFQVSLILFYINKQKNQNYFLEKRITKIIKLYVFWGIINQIFTFFSKKEEYLSALFISLSSFKKILIFILTDGNSAPFYFFFSLLFLTTLAELFTLLINNYNLNKEIICYLLLIFSCIIVILLPLSKIFFGETFDILPQVYNPLNFIPYIFSSFLISNYLLKNKINQSNDNNIYQIWTKIFLLILFVVFSVLEWKYLNYPLLWGWSSATDNALPIYSRVSLVFGAWFITLISLKVSSEPPVGIKLLSDLSLGIYCLHLFFIFLFLILFPVQYPTYMLVLILFITFFLSAILTKFLKKFQILKDII